LVGAFPTGWSLHVVSANGASDRMSQRAELKGDLEAALR